MGRKRKKAMLGLIRKQLLFVEGPWNVLAPRRWEVMVVKKELRSRFRSKNMIIC